MKITYEELDTGKFQKSYDVCLSLGFNCFTAILLKQELLQTATYPFDWSRGIDEEKAGVLGLDRKIDLIVNDFADWINPEDFIVFDENEHDCKNPHKNIRNQRTGLQYLHDFLKGISIQEAYPQFKEKYMRRKKRLQELLASGKSICLVFYAGMKFLNDDIIFKNMQKLSEKYPNADIDFLLLQNNPYMEKNTLVIEDLNEHIRKINFYNYEFAEEIQGRGENIGANLSRIMHDCLILKQLKPVFHVDDLSVNQVACVENGWVGVKDSKFSGILTWGPYISLEAGNYEIDVCYKLAKDYKVYVDVVCDLGNTLLAKKDLVYGVNHVQIKLNLAKKTDKIEVRTNCLGSDLSKDNLPDGNLFSLNNISVKCIE